MAGREQLLAHPALTDPGTGLASLLHFDVVYRYLFAGADRGVPLTLLLLSAPAPDAATLRTLGEAMLSVTRAADLVAHVGGGRFAVLLLGCNLSGGRLAADRFETALQAVTEGPVSIGIASYRPEMKEQEELTGAAERALQAAESAGGGLEMAG